MTRVAELHRQLARLHAELAEELERSENETGLVSEAELVRVLGSKGKILRLMKTGDLVGSKVGQRIVVKRPDLDAFLATRKIAPRAPQKPRGGDEIDFEAIARANGLRMVKGGR